MIIASDEFVDFPKMARLSRKCQVTEKIDGTNAQICITDEGKFLVGSRTRWIQPCDALGNTKTDNMGFAKWAYAHEEELRQLGPGRHFGEWWGSGIQRGYGQKEKHFSLFNALRWVPAGAPTAEKQMNAPACCRIVPILYQGIFSSEAVQSALDKLVKEGSYAAPGFMDAEGVVVYHVAAQVGFKKTIKHDEVPKGLAPKE